MQKGLNPTTGVQFAALHLGNSVFRSVCAVVTVVTMSLLNVLNIRNSSLSFRTLSPDDCLVSRY